MGLATYGIWGFFPAFFQLLRPAGAFEILAHRVVWTALLMAAVLLLGRRLGDLRNIPRRDRTLLIGSTSMILTNWLLFSDAVNDGLVVDSAIGYYITPLVTVTLGVFVFGERLNRTQRIALGIAVAAVVLFVAGTDRTPWLGFGIACSFAAYGALHKVLTIDSALSVTAETAMASPVAIIYLLALESLGHGHFMAHGAPHILLTMTSGLLTACTLMLFATAAQGLPLVTLGLLQYLMPSIQLAWGVLVDHEVITTTRWSGLGLIWLSLLLFSGDALLRSRNR